MRNQKKRDTSHDQSLDAIGMSIVGIIVCLFLTLIF